MTRHPPPSHGVASLGATLRARREEIGLSLRAATDGVPGISASTLSRVETGERQLAHGPALIALAERLRMSREDVVDLAGGLSPEGASELLGADVRLALHGGRLVPAGREALRSVHLAALARQRGGASIETLAAELDMDFRAALDPPGFDDDPDIFRIPRDEKAVIQRMWKAHGVAHAVLAREAHARPDCNPGDTVSVREREATRLGRLLLVPSAALHGAHRKLGAPEPRNADELSSLVGALVEALRAPAGWVAVRLAEEGLLGVAA